METENGWCKWKENYDYEDLYENYDILHVRYKTIIFAIFIGWMYMYIMWDLFFSGINLKASLQKLGSIN